MNIKTMSSLFVVALGFALWTANTSFQVLLQFVVCAAAVLMMLQARHAQPQSFVMKAAVTKPCRTRHWRK
jgi:type IV secretory pathway VirB2 component (pilin)